MTDDGRKHVTPHPSIVKAQLVGHTGPREVLVHLYGRCSNPVHDVSGTLPYHTVLLPACYRHAQPSMRRARAAEAALTVYGGHLRPCAYSGSYPRQLDRGVGYPEGLVVCNVPAYSQRPIPRFSRALMLQERHTAPKMHYNNWVGLRGQS